MPYKVLCYSEPDLNGAKIAYTSSAFIMKRHGLNQEDMKDYDADLLPIINKFPKNILSPTNLENVDKNFGILFKESDFDYTTTVTKIKTAINAQGDTRMFGEINFKKEAEAHNISLEPTLLILFGAPEPGGKAMHTTPKLGLDAFCQKILIYKSDNKVFVAYNDIVVFSKLYYNKSSIPQRIINYSCLLYTSDAADE